jgi:polar amino acid transport system substrate-binding protein
MKKHLISLILLMGSFASFASQEVLIGTGEWPPYAGAKLKGFGFLNDVVSTAFTQEGITANLNAFILGKCAANCGNLCG